ncbi:hypothetical protein EVAR_28253_1 [Eumeta japonica]|uniref:Uncharacterized protein n=1 Tax=Eumeta variegata TaxID=151549 RepID=A0A4C1V661_EUMVA|nr:hypothetical protein EVAR_28253_1 [Eumeta japonica]
MTAVQKWAGLINPPPPMTLPKFRLYEPNRRGVAVKYHTLTEYGLEVAASDVVFPPVSECSSGRSLPSLTRFLFPELYPIASQKVGNVLMTLLEL